MRLMVRFLFVVSTCVIFLGPVVAIAQEDAAQRAAEDILRSLAAGQFKDIWNQKVSKFMKDRTTEDVFLSTMSIGRPQLGKLQNLKYVSTQHLNRDPQSGFEGDIYFIVFRTTYTNGEFFEHIAVVKDSDGKYRFSGLGGAPVPK